MTSLKEFFSHDEKKGAKGLHHKNNILKRRIVSYMAARGQCTITELTKHLHISIPTITKLIGELVADNIVTDNGKVETAGGRRPKSFGLTNSAIYFAGIEVSFDNIQFVITDLKNNIITSLTKYDFTLFDNDESLETICQAIERFLAECGVDRNKILGLGMCITGRVNPATGCSYNFFAYKERPLSAIIEDRIGMRVLLENDTRAWCYAEHVSGDMKREKNMVYLHLGRGVAIGIVIDGKLCYGKSGFAGEFGHTPFYDNEIICTCGKKGCLQTEISGMAIESRLIEKMKSGHNSILRDKYERGEMIHIDDIVAAAHKDDTLAIELIEDAAEKIGRGVAFLINIFNPNVVILGGNLSRAGDYLMLPMKAATRKYSLNLVYQDTEFRLSHTEHYAGAMGAARLIRNHIIEMQ